MIYRDFLGEHLSLLGFGAMRLPILDGGGIDHKTAEQMIDLAIQNGVNYFDTAYPYHEGKSEIVLGKILSKYPRESFYLADKFPGHQLMKCYDPAAIFEEQLEKCGVEYFDFYLLHNVYERSMGVYTDPEIGILKYFIEQKKNGRIKHLGFSTHALTDGLREFLDIAGEHMEFCQIQMNYLDNTLQDAKGKYDLLKERNIPVIIMEPVRGGKLANLSGDNAEKLKALRPDASFASYAFRWLFDYDNIAVILSGMSNMEHVADNIATFNAYEKLSEVERTTLEKIAFEMLNSVPCTGCRYCVDGCPMGLEIPLLITTLNELRVSKSMNASMKVEFLPDDKKPSACIGCGACSAICPQSIDVPNILAELSEIVSAMPKWADVSREREKVAEKMKAAKKSTRPTI